MERLPELAWSLPYWPKNHLSFVSRGLFYLGVDWQPKAAIYEIEQRLKALILMPANEPKAQFLSQKILKQVEVLVKMSQALDANKKRFHPPRGLTRPKHIQALHEKKQALETQYQALVKAKSLSRFSQEIQVEMDVLLRNLEDIEKLLASA